MKYIKQILIIFIVSFAAEMIKKYLPFPIPASIYGIGIMFLCLLTGIIKEEQISDVADYMISVMPIFFIEPSIKLMNSFDIVKGSVIKIFVVAIVSTFVANLVTGFVCNMLMKGKYGDGVR